MMSDQAIRVQAQERECFPPVGSAHESLIRGCLKIESGPAAVDFGGGQGGEACASPQSSDCLRAAHVNSRQLTGRGLGSQSAEPTPANAKRRAEGPLSILRQALNGKFDLPWLNRRPSGSLNYDQNN